MVLPIAAPTAPERTLVPGCRSQVLGVRCAMAALCIQASEFRLLLLDVLQPRPGRSKLLYSRMREAFQPREPTGASRKWPLAAAAAPVRPVCMHHTVKGKTYCRPRLSSHSPGLQCLQALMVHLRLAENDAPHGSGKTPLQATESTQGMRKPLK